MHHRTIQSGLLDTESGGGSCYGGKWEVGIVIFKAALAEINWNSPSLVTFLRLGVEGSLSHELQSSDIQSQ